jgi:hypothetical protein
VPTPTPVVRPPATPAPTPRPPSTPPAPPQPTVPSNFSQLPSWENTELNSLYSQGLLSGVQPGLIGGIDVAESSGSGGSINPEGYGGWFGLGANSSYTGPTGTPYQDTPWLLEQTTPQAFAQQAETAAGEYGSLLKEYGGNVYEAEQAYQQGGGNAASYATSPGEGDTIFRQLGIPGTEQLGATNPSNSNPISALLNQILAGQEQQQALQTQGTQNQLGYQQQAFQNEQAQLAQQYQNQLAQYGLTGETYGIQGRGLTQEQQELAFANTIAGKQYGLTQLEYAQQLGYGREQLGFEQQSLAQQEYQTKSGLAASGVYNTGALTQADRAINLQWAQEQASTAFSQAQEAEQKQASTLGYQAQENSYAYSQDQITNARAQLDVQLQQLGLNKQEAYQGLQNALTNAGLQNVMTGDQLLTQIAMLNIGMTTPITSMLGALTQNGLVSSLVNAAGQSVTGG